MPDAPHRPPPWHRSRMGWVNGLGFALTLYLAIWLLLAVFLQFLPKAEPPTFTISPVYIGVVLVAQAVTVALAAFIIFRFVWQGANFEDHLPRLVLFFWTCAGLLFFLCQFVVFLQFGTPRLPNIATIASDMYWGSSGLGLVTFALMAYVNIDVISEATGDPYDEHDEDEFAGSDAEDGPEERFAR